jgi:hypothetical protein
MKNDKIQYCNEHKIEGKDHSCINTKHQTYLQPDSLLELHWSLMQEHRKQPAKRA